MWNCFYPKSLRQFEILLWYFVIQTVWFFIFNSFSFLFPSHPSCVIAGQNKIKAFWTEGGIFLPRWFRYFRFCSNLEWGQFFLSCNPAYSLSGKHPQNIHCWIYIKPLFLMRSNTSSMLNQPLDKNDRADDKLWIRTSVLSRSRTNDHPQMQACKRKAFPPKLFKEKNKWLNIGYLWFYELLDLLIITNV